MAVALRATRKVMRSLSRSEGNVVVSDNALGDWYVNRIVIARQPLLLLVSAASRLAILDFARNVKALPSKLPVLVSARLTRAGIPATIVVREQNSTMPVSVAPTSDRSIVGQMVDFAKALPHYLTDDDWNEADLCAAEDRLAETPCLPSKRETIFPLDRARKLLEEKWS